MTGDTWPQEMIRSRIDLPLVAHWVVEAGQIALARQRDLSAAELDYKSDHSPVTAIDREVEAHLLACIAEAYPAHQVLAEESGAHPGGDEITWVIDPIDGTRAYASGLPVWAVSVGVLAGKTSLAGVVHLPVPGDLYAVRPGMALRNGQPLPPARPVGWDDPLAYIAVSSDAHRRYEIAYPRVRSMGSTVAHLIHVSCGTAVGTLVRRAWLWDLAGVLPLLVYCGIALEYWSGASFEIASLLSGQPIREPLLVARPEHMARFRACLLSR